MKNILRITCLIFFIIIFGYNYSLGQGVYQEAELLTLYIGEIKTIPVNTPTRVVINNPNVADVTSVSKDEIFVAGKGSGTTNLVWWDNLGQHALQLQVFTEDMGLVKQRIDSVLKELNLPDVFTRRADSEGKVLLLGSVKKKEDKERTALALETLKAKIVDLIVVKEEEAAVEIDVQLLELNKDATKTLGFTMPSSIAVTEPSTRFSKTMRGSMEAIFHVFEWRRENFDATLDLLVEEGKARILSRPRLSCQSGKEAELLVGGEKPILTTMVSGGGEGTNVGYKEYGIKLKIKPTVAGDKKIKLALKVEVSEVGTAEILGFADAPTAKAYPLTKRNASTELFLNDGQTMAIGGLIKQKTETDISKTAFLGDIPIIGALFRKKTTKIGGGEGERGDTELFITLTPKIIGEKEKEIKKEEELTKLQEPPQPKEIPTPAKEGSSVVVARYTQMVARRIQDNLIYPWAASQGKLEGTLRLGLRLHNTGQILDVRVSQSSGFGVLDENALRTVKETSPFLPFPPEIEAEELYIEIPVVYSLKQK